MSTEGLDRVRDSVETADEVIHALALVGKTPRRVLDVLGSLAEDGDIYLVGSLGAGLGNAGSDIDVHIVVGDTTLNNAPGMFFVDECILDVQYFARSAISEAVGALRTETAALAGARCALGLSLSRRDAKRLSRWATAVPFDRDSPKVLMDDDDLELVRAGLVRAAFDDAVIAVWVAEVLDRAGRPSSYAWRCAGRSVLEVVARCRGDVFVGTKWVWSKARRLGLPTDMVTAVASVSDPASWRSALQRCGLAAFAPAGLVSATWATAATEPVTVAGVAYQLVDKRRLVAGIAPSSGGTQVELGPDEVVAGLAEGVVKITIDIAAVDELVMGGSY